MHSKAKTRISIFGNKSHHEKRLSSTPGNQYDFQGVQRRLSLGVIFLFFEISVLVCCCYFYAVHVLDAIFYLPLAITASENLF